MAPHKSRTHVRENIFLEVGFRILSPVEYESLKRAQRKELSICSGDLALGQNEDEVLPEIPADDPVLAYLLRLEKKLDRVIKLVSQRKWEDELLERGLALDISGSGMRIAVDQAVDIGEVIHLKFYLSMTFPILVELFGEVANVAQIEQDDRTMYQLGVKFIDLDANDRELIINYVFQRQRAAIRSRKTEVGQLGQAG